jgi:hypothetical protein
MRFKVFFAIFFLPLLLIAQTLSKLDNGRLYNQDGSLVLPALGLTSGDVFAPLRATNDGKLMVTGTDSGLSLISTQTKVPSTGAVFIDTGDGIGVRAAPLAGLTSGGLFVPLLVDGTGKLIVDGAGGGGGSGTVTSVALSAPSFLSVSGSPVTTSGTLALSLANQSANTIFAGPTTGGAAAPTFRSMVAADLPTVTVAKGGTNSTSYAGDGLMRTNSAGTTIEEASGWEFNADGGLNSLLTVYPTNPASPEFPVGHEHQFNAIPTENAANENRTAFRYTLAVDDPNDGFNYGESTSLAAEFRHSADGTLSGATALRAGVNLGNTGTTGSVNNAQSIQGSLSVTTGQSVTQNARVADLSLSVDGTVENIQAVNTSITINEGTIAQEFAGFKFSPLINTDASINYINGFMFNPSLAGSMSGNMTAYGAYGGGSNAPNNFIAYDAGPSFSTQLTNMTGLNVYSNADIQNFSGVNVGNSNALVTVDNYTGVNINAGTTGTNFRGVQITGNGTYDSVIGLDVNVTGYTNPTGGLPVGLNNNGTINSNYNFTYDGSTPPPQIQINFVGSGITIPDGNPLSGTFGFGDNFASLVFAEDDYTDDISGLGLGWSSVGFVGQMSVASGKTFSDVNGALAGFGIPVQSTGGTVTNARMFRAAGMLPQGGTLTVTNMYAFLADSILCGVATNCWGVYIADDSAQNYFAGEANADKGFRLSTSGSQPTCTSAIRGLMWNVEGGTGVADQLQICQKDASDNYVWVSL